MKKFNPIYNKTLLFILFYLLFTGIGNGVIASNTQQGKIKHYITQRGNLTNSFHKFTYEKKGCVAFLGGSITEMEGWRNMIQEDLRKRFPDTKFQFIDAGIGSTGSTPHAFRFENDVLKKGTPDLLFVEAAVNDHTNKFSPEDQVRGMEGIVQHARQINPYMDILMLHFIYAPFLKQLDKGIQPDVIMNHERVANHDYITSINLAQEIAERLKNKEFTWKEFGGTHPSQFGHTFYAKAIESLFDHEQQNMKAENLQAHYIPEKPLDKSSYLQGAFIDIKEATELNGFKYIESWTPESSVKAGTRKGFVQVPMLEAKEGGASFKLNFTGRAIGIFCVSGPNAGVLEYSIDGKPFRQMKTHTPWSNKVYLPWVYMFDKYLKPGQHTLIVRIKEGTRSECQIRNFVVNR